MSEFSLDSILEAILFVASEPLSDTALAAASARPVAEVTAALATLAARLSGGIRLSEVGGTYRLVTAPEAVGMVGAFLADTNRQDLSRPALETLAIVAYKGPLTKSQIETVRGVASETMLRNLLARGLIMEAGRSSEPGRPQLFAVSHTFLAHFGLTSASDLPPLPEEAVHEN